MTEKVAMEKLVNFEQDLSAVFFFKDIYDKSKAYFSAVRNKIISEFSLVVSDLDKEIHHLQVKEQENMKMKMEMENLFKKNE